jgi:hypothetical protein
MLARYFFAGAVLVMVAAAAPALAFDTGKLGQGGSLILSDIMPLIAKSPRLKSEVESALDAAKKKADDQICDGMRFPGSWANLGGERVAPYTCDFGGKWLRINATVRITGAKGKVFETITPAAMKNASKVSETELTWTWAAEDPDKDK